MKNPFFNRFAIVLLSAAILTNVSTKGANYYFSSSQGDDSRTTSEAQNPSTPWKTINKLNSFFSSLKPGDSVLFKRGDIFYGSITITVSGTASAQIVLGAYGTGNKPVITEFAILSGWTSLGGGIYESSAIFSAGTSVKMVTLDGNVQQMGRYPNADAPNSGYLTYQSHIGQTSITSNQISGIPNFVGGEVVIRPIRHILDRCIISGQTSTTVSYTKVSSYVPINGYGFFFQNHINTLDEFGEWYYNPTTKKIDMYFGSNDPSTYVVRCSTLDYCATGQSRNYITFDNLKFVGANKNGIYLLGGSKINISNCDFIYHGEEGIYTQSSTFVNISNSTVNWCNSNGIFLRASNTAVSSNSIINCTVTNIGTFAGMGESGDAGYSGIYVNGGKNVVMNNVVSNTGYDGIKFVWGDSSLIKNNYVTNYCFIKNDGGGIYTWNNVRDNNGNLSAITYYGNKIIGNVVMYAGNADAGTIYTEAGGTYGSHGIYCDGNSRNIEVSGNTVAYNGKGIFLHDNQNMDVKNNIVFNNKERQLDVYYDDTSLPPVRGINIKNNLLFSQQLVQETGGFRTLYNDLENFGSYDSNYYAQAIYKENLISSKYVKNGLAYTQNFNVNGWKLAYSDDQHSKPGAATLSEYTLNNILSSNKYINGTYDAKISGTISYNKGGTCVSSWDNSGKLDGGAFRLSYKGTSTVSTTTNVVINVGVISSSKNYILRYSMMGTKDNGSVGVYLRQGKSTYNALTPIKYYTLNSNRTDNEVLFSFPESDNNGQIVFQFNDRDSTVYLDNVQLYEADVTVTNPDDYVRFEYNPSNTPKTISLDATYIGVDSTIYSGDVTLQPYSSVILMKQSAATTLTLQNSVKSSNAVLDNTNKTSSNSVKLKLVTFPNPSPNEFNLLIQSNSDEKVEINLFDMNGKNILYTTGSSKQKYVFGRSLPSGSYILRVAQGNDIQTMKLIK